jgi:hypothetical protein
MQILVQCPLHTPAPNSNLANSKQVVVGHSVVTMFEEGQFLKKKFLQFLKIQKLKVLFFGLNL